MVISNLIKSAKKVPLKINDISIKILLIDRCQATVAAPNERYTDVFMGLYVPFLQSNFAVPNLIKTSKTHPRLPYKHLYGRLFLSGPGYLTEMARTRNIIIIASCIIGIFSELRTWTRVYYGESSD